MLGVKDGPAPGAHVAGGFKRKSSTAVRRAPSLRISSARSLWLESHSVVRICGGGSGRAHTAHPSGCGPARLHGWIAAAMSCLRAVRDAVVVSVSGGNGHRQKRKCEQRSSWGRERFQIHCYASFLSRGLQGIVCARIALAFKRPIKGRAPFGNDRLLHCRNVCGCWRFYSSVIEAAADRTKQLATKYFRRYPKRQLSN